jgi:hypothetical protein
LSNYCFAVGIPIDKYDKKSPICDSENQMATSSTTITVSGHNAQWGWEGDKSIWQQYPINIQQEISQAFDAGKKEVNEILIFNLIERISCLGRCECHR